MYWQGRAQASALDVRSESPVVPPVHKPVAHLRFTKKGVFRIRSNGCPRIRVENDSAFLGKPYEPSAAVRNNIEWTPNHWLPVTGSFPAATFQHANALVPPWLRFQLFNVPT